MAGRTAQSLAAESAFRHRLKELGAELLETEWLGAQQPHRARCRAGHDCRPRPNCVQQGRGICIKCAGKDPVATEAAFLKRLAELGCTSLYERYRGRNTPHDVLCPAGHRCRTRPGELQRGRGACRICVGLDRDTAEAEFYARVKAMGAVALEPYRNARTKVHVQCSEGHDCYPTGQSVQQGKAICAICSGRDPAVIDAAFRARLAELGATPIYDEYRGVEHALHVRCKAGHDCYPKPHYVLSGDGLCRLCARTEFDAFYVVTGNSVVKFGVTTGNGKQRLLAHAKDGYGDVVRLVTGLPGTLALDTENAVKGALSLAREAPVRGREYFDVSCLALVLDIADAWLAAPERSAAKPEPATLKWVQGELFAA